MKKALLLTGLLFAAFLSSCGTAAGSSAGSGTAPEASAETAPQSEAETTQTTAAPAELDFSALRSIEISSDDLKDGVWNTDITKTANGSNRSPQLSWAPVEGAASYAVYMVDTTATCWLHWKAGNITETTLPAGWASEKYIGPYPPSGTHNYEIRVFALKEPVIEDKSKFNASNFDFDQMTTALDQSSSGSGNILAYGTLTGTYTHGD